MAVLVSVSLGVACDLRAASGDTTQKIAQRIETQRSAKIVIDDLHDGGATEFVPEFR